MELLTWQFTFHFSVSRHKSLQTLRAISRRQVQPHHARLRLATWTLFKGQH
jgi:hypothetical protein